MRPATGSSARPSSSPPCRSRRLPSDHQWTGIFQIPVLDRIRGPISERADQAGRVVSRIMRKDVGADQEQVVAIPTLQEFVDRAVAWTATHDGAPGVVGA